MKQILTAALLAALAVALPLYADDKPKDKPAEEKKSRADDLKELQAEFQKLLPDVVKEWRQATDDAGKNKALAKLDPILERAFKLVAAEPKDEVSLDTLLFTIRMKPEPPAKTLDLLAEHHLKNPRFQGVVQQFALNPNPAFEQLLRTVQSKAEGKDLKGLATFGLGQLAFQKSDNDSLSRNEAAKFSKEAETILASVVKDFADVKGAGGTLGKLAEKTLFEIRNLAIGKTAPEVVSKDLDGKETKLSSYKGKVVVLDIWATWCGPCRAMIPHEREMVEKLKDKPFRFISISADDKVETLKEFLEKEKMPWTHWWEGRREGGIVNDWNVRFFPTIYVIDAKGVIRYKGVRGKQLEEAVEKLVKEAETKS